MLPFILYNGAVSHEGVAFVLGFSLVLRFVAVGAILQNSVSFVLASSETRVDIVRASSISAEAVLGPVGVALGETMLTSVDEPIDSFSP